MTNEYIEMDNLFMFLVDLRRDKCMWNEELYRYPFDEKIHNNFQNILDLVKPLKKIRPCSDDEIEKYKFYFDKDIENTLDYEKCYTVLLEQVKDKTTDEKIAFLAPYIPYLLAVLNNFTAVDDVSAYARFKDNETIAFLLVYRYEHNISIMKDLRMDVSEERVCGYHSKVCKRLAEEKYWKLAELKNNKPEEYQKYEKKQKDWQNILLNRINELKVHGEKSK
ncbi:MAG: hypothetical protein II944_08760 [Ruminobacter sp.]|nr:hypothetical protein [Ruminobacter sp.]